MQRLRVLTWNIDGLDPAAAEGRALGVLREILAADADVVLLQEVTPPWLGAALQPVLGGAGYASFPPWGVRQGYGSMVFSRRPVVAWGQASLPETHMGRLLVTVELADGVRVLTGHLESLAAGAAARRAQLAAVMAALGAAQAEGQAALFGGDTNLREAEVSPEAAACDAWTLAGAPEAARYTWDLVRNRNKVMPDGGRPRARYDRVFVAGLSVERLALVGEAPVAEAGGRWPSDHFGVLVEVCRAAGRGLDKAP